MQSTLFSDDSRSAQAVTGQRSGRRYGKWWLSLLSGLPLCLALLACKPGEAVAYKGPEQTETQVAAEVARRPSATAGKGKAATVALADLPALEQRVYRLIFQGGPFPYSKDGSVFANRERLLPVKKRGFYREYTVAPPRARSRGARRIVCGGPRVTPEVCYYTADHYASFQQIVPN